MGIVVALAIMLSSAGIGLFIAYRVLRAEIDTRPARRQIGYAVVVFAVTMVILIAIGVLLGGPVRRYALEVLFGFLTAALWGVLGWLVAGLVNGGKALVRLPRPPR